MRTRWHRRLSALTVPCLAALAIAWMPGVAAAGILDSVRGWTRDQVVARLNELLPGTLVVGDIRGSPFGDLELRDVTLHYDGETVLAVRHATANLAYSALLQGDIVLETLELERPLLRLRQEANGDWNLLRALVASPPPDASPTPSPTVADGAAGAFPFAIRHFAVQRGAVRVTTSGETSRTYQVSGLAARGGLRLGGAAPHVELAALEGTLRGPDLPLARLSGGIAYDGAGDGAATVRQLTVRTARSRLTLDGRAHDLGAPTVLARATLRPLAAADAGQLVSGWPLATDVRGRLTVHGPPANLDAAATLHSAGAIATLDARADVTGEQPRFAATIELRAARPAELAPEWDVGGVARGHLFLTGAGTALGQMTGTAALAIDDLRAAGRPVGQARLQATLDDAELAFQATVQGAGRADLEGEVGLDDQTYRLEIATENLRAAALAMPAPALPTSLTMDARLRGQGFAPATARLDATVDLQPSTLGPLDVDRGHLVVHLADGRLRVREARLAAADATVSIDGELGLAAASEGRLAFAVAVPRLEPFLAIAGQEGSGALALDGVVRGSLDDLAVEGTAELEKIRLSGRSLRSGTSRFALHGIGTPRMSGTVSTRLTQVEAGIALARLDLDVDVTSGQPLAADFTLDARTTDGRPESLRGAARVGAGETTVQLRDVVLDVPGGAWTLPTPATVSVSGRTVAVDSLRLRNGAQSLEVDGHLGPTPGAALRITIRDVDLGVVNTYAPQAVSDVQGVLAADLRIAGSLDDPRPSGSLSLTGGRARLQPIGITVDDIQARLDADPSRLDITELSARAGEGTVKVEGNVRLNGDRPAALALRLRADRWPAIDTPQATARIDAALDVHGTLTAPVVDGRVNVRRATLRPQLAMLTEASGPAPRDQTIVVIQEQRAAAAAESGGGGFDVAALMTGLAVDVAVHVSDDTWIKHDAASLALLGDVTLRKVPRGELALVGDVRVVQGWILFRGHRFALREGDVRFTGGQPIDPSLDVVLETRVAGYTVQAIVGGTATGPTLAFASSPDLADADILALLLFGRRVTQLDDSEQQSLQQQAGFMAANLAASRLSTAVADRLGLGLVITDVDVANGGFGVGRYLTPNTFVSLSQELGGTAEQQVTIDYYLSPQWSLSTSTDTGGENTADIFWRYEY